MNNFKQFFEAVSYKDIRGNVVRKGDYVYIRPEYFEEVQKRGTTFKQKIPYFKFPYGYVIAARDESLLVNTVKILNDRLIPYESFRGKLAGRQLSIPREALVKLEREERLAISNFSLGK